VSEAPALPPPLGLLAELTHRCPLRCPYCSNPVDLQRRSAELDTDTWLRVFREAAALGVLQLHLSGGEPTARADIVALTRGAAEAGLYTNLITSGVGVGEEGLAALVEAGLDHLQLSIQDVEPDEADRVAGLPGAHRRKRAFAHAVAGTPLAFTINLVIHRDNVGRVDAMIDEAAALGAGRIEVAHAQYYGWGLANRAALMPGRDAALRARDVVEAARQRLAGSVAIDYVPPDYLGRFPKPCVNGWGRRVVNVAPDGTALPCHAAATIPGLEFWNVRDRALGEIWRFSPAFEAYRGTAWVREPCTSCPRLPVDFGGCRCQAFAITGDARNADPVCSLSPYRDRIDAALAEPKAPLRYREFAARPGREETHGSRAPDLHDLPR
jgi:PqqA peptide cyclase